MDICFDLIKVYKSFILFLFICIASSLSAQNNNNELEIKSRSEVKSDSIDAFLVTKVTRSQIYKDEAVVLVCQLYTRAPLLAVKEINYPVLDGFEVGSKPFYDHRGIPVFRKEKYKEVLYYVSDLRKIVLYPTKEGQFIIPEVEAVLTFNDKQLDENLKGRSSEKDVVRSVDKRLRSEKTLVKVLELPRKEPVGFSGAIGTFKMKSSLNDSEAKVEELFALEMIVEGYGDLSISSAPILDLPEGLEIYDMQSQDSSFFSDQILKSYRAFGYLLIASKSGVYKIPEARFIYLDVDSGTYKTLVSSEHTVVVKKAEIKGSVTAIR